MSPNVKKILTQSLLAVGFLTLGWFLHEAQNKVEKIAGPQSTKQPAKAQPTLLELTDEFDRLSAVAVGKDMYQNREIFDFDYDGKAKTLKLHAHVGYTDADRVVQRACSALGRRETSSIEVEIYGNDKKKYGRCSSPAPLGPK